MFLSPTLSYARRRDRSKTREPPSQKLENMKTSRSAAVLTAALVLAAAALAGDPAPSDEGSFKNVILEAKKALPDARLRRISIIDEGDEAGYFVEARRGDDELRLRMDPNARIIELTREGAPPDAIRAAVERRLPGARILEAVRREVRAERRLIPLKKSRRGYEVALRRGELRAVAFFDESGKPREEIEWRSPEDDDEEDGDEGDESDEGDEGEEGEPQLRLEPEALALVSRELSRRFPASRLTFAHTQEAFDRLVYVCGLEGPDGGRVVFFEAETRGIWRIERGVEPKQLPAPSREAIARIPEAEVAGAAAIESFFEAGWRWLEKPRIVHEARFEREELTGVLILDSRGKILEGPFWDGEDPDESDEDDEGDEGDGDEGDEDEGDGDE